MNKLEIDLDELNISLRPSYDDRVLSSSRILCLMSIFAVASFAFVDPFLVEGSIWDLLKVRGVMLFFGVGLLLFSSTSLGKKTPQIIGGGITLLTGFGVVVLTEQTGGADSFYWTMILLTFFTVALLLPMNAWLGLFYFGSIAIFFDFWLIFQDATGAGFAWITSNAGIWLSVVISVTTVRFLEKSRLEQSGYEQELLHLNRKLVQEILDRQKAEADQRIAEDNLKETQKLDAIGRLSAGVAHEVNNILTTIICSVDLLKDDRLVPERFEVDLNRILLAADSGSKLVGDLLRFSRKGHRESKVFSPKLIIVDLVDLLCKTNRGRIFEMDVSEDLQLVIGDSQLFFQVLLNLCLNSIDASLETEAIIIKAHNLPPIEGASHNIEISVIDNGSGMTSEVKSKAFEPFFTTKESSFGTGLGLSMVYGTVHDHGGKIQLKSEKGIGTTVTILLPSIEGKPADTHTHESPKEFNGLLRILVIDDDQMVREMFSEILSLNGHQVTLAASGQVALDILTASDSPFDLVILDVIMPNMSGVECYQNIQKISPSQKVIFCSGYTDSQVLQPYLDDANCCFLSKPFRTKLMLALIAELILDE